MRKRFTYGYVKEFLEEHLYILLDKEYINAHVKLKMKCPKGHVSYRTFDSFKRGNRCKKCSFKTVGEKFKKNYKEIQQFIESIGYSLKSKKYKNAYEKLNIICSKGHLFKAGWHHIQQGGRCSVCFGTPKKTIEEIKILIKNKGFECLSDKYVNAVEKLKIRCKDGHVFEACWNGLTGCPICSYINRVGEKHWNWKGGISREPYCEIFSDKEFREYIKYRDGNVCINPICKKISKILTIHHIDYNKQNCSINNLITICCSCNTTANNDRSWHESWYRTILFRRYDY